eukprot:392736_1
MISNEEADGPSNEAHPTTPPIDQSNSPPEIESVWTNVVWLGGRLLSGAEFVGEVLVEFFGLNASKYQYVVDAKERYLAELQEEEDMEQAAMTELQEINSNKLSDAKDSADREKNEAPSPPSDSSSDTLRHPYLFDANM